MAVDAAFGAGGVRDVVVPTLTAYLPEATSTTAVVVCPGGALHLVSIDGEGHRVALALQAVGIAAYVLKYRVVPTPPDEPGFLEAIRDAFADMEGSIVETLPLAVADAGRAIELVRAEGFEHVSLLGFSAGGRVAAGVVTAGERSEWPDSVATIYAPTVRPGTTAPPDAVPLFVLAAADDPLGIEGSLALHRAWSEVARSVELHLYELGGHGFGIESRGIPVDGWLDRFVAWLRSRSC